MYNQHTARDRKIFLERMTEEKSLSQISLEYNISKSRVGQIIFKQTQSFYKLKDVIKDIEKSFNSLNKNILLIQSQIISIRNSDIFINKFTDESDEVWEGANDLVQNLDLSFRSENVLLRAGIKTIDQLCGCSRQYLLKLPNFGRKSLREIEEVLKRNGRSLSTYEGIENASY